MKKLYCVICGKYRQIKKPKIFVIKFKAKNSEVKKYPLCSGNISGDFSANNMKKQD